MKKLLLHQNIMILLRGGLLALCCILLASCMTAGDRRGVEIVTDEMLKAKQLKLSTIKSWNMKGRIGIKTKRRGGSATMLWKYSETQQYIDLSGPLGNGRVTIEVTPTKAVLNDIYGKKITGENASQVLFKKLGWKVPFDELIYWSRGIPNPGAEDIQYDESGRLKKLKHGFWLVEYVSYRMVDGIELPRKINIESLPGYLEIFTNAGKYLGGELYVRLVIKHWWGLEL